MPRTSRSIAIIIPARYGSSRFPGKPLAMISGRTMINRVWALARAVSGVDEVCVATDDERIANHVRNFGGHVVLTGEECTNGTERVLRASEMLATTPSVVLNLQGDAVLTPPWVIAALIDEMRRDPTVEIATAAVRMDKRSYEALRKAKGQGEVGGTTVTFDRRGNALYFSKSVIPFVRNDGLGDDAGILPVFRHIGLYSYRYETLRRYVSCEPGPLEHSEKLEQLRALEYGIPIRVVEVDYGGRTHWAVDTWDDLKRVETIIREEGDLLKT
ncbi:3-deoxy-manno-octulosonate cytidylyltransferase [Mesorhizobium sp. M5C.F.Cr.IN.023.01.1.1]|uniref:3-deoxy-manno-octulosonate cytidylyltransferase n=1 Tax=Mesorhizobium sp. M5C.F.Cr.IN.023.01.1.1 TaxID=2496768 RepID=UPI000FCA9DD4|nr:3-deoxy-manno-octulosonate cytidylyltransferase [Mesorhizobium sp. M5C.F.Cr.IN.023.01.1.1]RUV77478.1 3-deoxy-manno-octulosonate cytidylyltransferase [Mesorhizobium sp. M5C.F.Cr.IN.023.01.1.1]